jgi:hypothetical protein
VDSTSPAKCRIGDGAPEPLTAVQNGGSLAGKESPEATSTASLGRVPGPGFALPAFIDGPPGCPHTVVNLDVGRPCRRAIWGGRRRPPHEHGCGHLAPIRGDRRRRGPARGSALVAAGNEPGLSRPFELTRVRGRLSPRRLLRVSSRGRVGTALPVPPPALDLVTFGKAVLVPLPDARLSAPSAAGRYVRNRRRARGFRPVAFPRLGGGSTGHPAGRQVRAFGGGQESTAHCATVGQWSRRVTQMDSEKPPIGRSGALVHRATSSRVPRGGRRATVAQRLVDVGPPVRPSRAARRPSNVGVRTRLG